MKTPRVVAVAIVSLTCIPLMARQLPNGGTGDPSGSSSLSSGPASQSPQANAAASASGQQSANAAAAHAYSLVVSEMRPVSGELEGKLNSQSAKPGDLVVVKTTQRMTTADGTEIPKGSRLLGHVIAAQAYAKSEANSQLRIAFDRAELHGGGRFAIHSMIQSLAPPRREVTDLGYGGAGAGAAGGEAGAMNGAMNGGMGGAAGGSVARQGSLGGAPGGAMGPGAPAAGQPNSSPDPSVDRTADGTNSRPADTPASMSGPMYGVVQLSDSLAPRYTGIPGLMLQADASGAASGILFAANGSIHLDAGTQLVLGIVVTGN